MGVAGAEHRLQGVDRAGPDVAEDNSECADDHGWANRIGHSDMMIRRWLWCGHGLVRGHDTPVPGALLPGCSPWCAWRVPAPQSFSYAFPLEGDVSTGVTGGSVRRDRPEVLRTRYSVLLSSSS